MITYSITCRKVPQRNGSWLYAATFAAVAIFAYHVEKEVELNQSLAISHYN